MKFKVISLFIMVVLLFSFTYTSAVYSDPNMDYERKSAAVKDEQKHLHEVVYGFDSKTMTINEIYEGSKIEAIIEMVSLSSDYHSAIVLDKGKKATDGEIQKGMIVQIYYKDDLQGEYKVAELLEPYDVIGRSGLGFCLPVDNIVLSPQMGGNISQYYHSNHRGVDIAYGGTHYPTIPILNGSNVRAVLGGTVEKAEYHNHASSWGYYVLIHHGGGLRTLYAHMQSNLQVSVGQTVNRGHIVGKVGNTPTPNTPVHLHFEVWTSASANSHVNPMQPLYLQGATTYTSTTPPPPPSGTRAYMQTTPNPNGPRIVVTSNGTGLYYTVRRVSNNSVIVQGYLASSSNSWNFALWGLAAGQYRLEIQAVGSGGESNCEIQTFTIGTSGVRAYMQTIPNPAGPQIMVTSTGTGLYYTVRRVSNNSVLEQGYLASSSNGWNFALRGLAAGQYRLEIQAVGPGGASNIEASTFTVS